MDADRFVAPPPPQGAFVLVVLVVHESETYLPGNTPVAGKWLRDEFVYCHPSADTTLIETGGGAMLIECRSPEPVFPTSRLVAISGQNSSVMARLVNVVKVPRSKVASHR